LLQKNGKKLGKNLALSFDVMLCRISLMVMQTGLCREKRKANTSAETHR
jgi:hypothetical protein